MKNFLPVLLAGAFAVGLVGSISLTAGVRVSLLDVGVSVFLLYCAWQQRTKKRVFPPLWPPIIAFGAAGLASILINAGGLPQFAQGAGLLYLVRFLWYAALYWAAASGTFSQASLLGALWGSGVAIAVLGLVQYVLYPDLRNLYYLGWDPHYQRLFSTLLDPNFTGIVLVLSILAGCSLYLKGKKVQIFAIAGQLILFAALLLTYSRSSYAAFVAAGVIAAFFTVRLRKFLAVLLGVFIILVVLLPKTGEGRNLLREASVSARVTNMRTGLELFSRSPIVGYGFNTLRYLSAIPTGPIISNAASGFDAIVVFVLATGGLVGFSPFFWPIWQMVRLGKKDIWYLAALGAVVIHSLFVNSFFYPWVMAFVWIWTGTIRASRDARS